MLSIGCSCLCEELTELIKQKAKEAAEHTSKVQVELSQQLRELREEAAENHLQMVHWSLAGGL